jgi:hypothetical protein
MNADQTSPQCESPRQLTLNEKNWIILRAINKQLNIFQDIEVVEVSKDEKNAKVRESVYSQTKYMDTYKVVQ